MHQAWPQVQVQVAQEEREFVGERTPALWAAPAFVEQAWGRAALREESGARTAAEAVEHTAAAARKRAASARTAAAAVRIAEAAVRIAEAAHIGVAVAGEARTGAAVRIAEVARTAEEVAGTAAAGRAVVEVGRSAVVGAVDCKRAGVAAGVADIEAASLVSDEAGLEEARSEAAGLAAEPGNAALQEPAVPPLRPQPALRHLGPYNPDILRKTANSHVRSADIPS